MLPEHMEQFYPMVSTKTRGEIIYEPVKLAVIDEGTIYLEVRTDVYRKHKSIREYIVKVIEERGISDRVDWQKIDRLIQEESGVATDVTMPQVVKNDKTINNSVKISFTRKIVDFFKSHFRKSI
jgi:L,D-transpeptidase ErfK/SrfK